jgi:hypothetical protein
MSTMNATVSLRAVTIDAISGEIAAVSMIVSSIK